MIAGITGHQDLTKYDLVWIERSIYNFLKDNNIKAGLSSLAVGADQLFVQILKEQNIPFTIYIPSANYDSTFQSASDLSQYRQLLKKAKNIIKLNFPQPSEEAFFQAGKKIVENSEILLAIWNGQKAQGLGGTADVVDYAKARKQRVYHINPVDQKIYSIND